MRTIIITDEVDEYLALKDDGVRSALIQKTKGMFPDWRNEKVIVLNPRQEQKLKDAITAIQRERAGQKGGNSTLMKYGNDHFVEIGKQGGRPKAKTLEGGEKMDLSALMKDLKQIDPKIKVSVKVKQAVGAELVIPILRRTIKYDATGRKISDTTTNLINKTLSSLPVPNEKKEG